MIEELDTADNRSIAVVREKLHHYRWMASKLIGIYGDKQEIKQDTNITIQWSTEDKDIKNVTNSVSTDAANTLAHVKRFVRSKVTYQVTSLFISVKCFLQIIVG